MPCILGMQVELARAHPASRKCASAAFVRSNYEHFKIPQIRARSAEIRRAGALHGLAAAGDEELCRWLLHDGRCGRLIRGQPDEQAAIRWSPALYFLGAIQQHRPLGAVAGR